MCNCNQKRAAYTASQNSEKGTTRVKYTGALSLVVTGAMTGRTYRFEQRNDVVLVDQRDLEGIREHSELQVL